MIPLLMIDDDVELGQMLREYLEAEGYALELAHDGPSGLQRARRGDCALILLDVMLPGLGGFDVLREFRRDHDTPVLMLTARGEDTDTVVGLELGADDYLAKPFNPRVLAARIRAVLRRRAAAAPASSSALVVGDLSLDAAARTVSIGGRPVELTGAEFNVLEPLVRAAGSLVDKDSLCEQALGRRLQPFDRSIDMHVSNLRRKLGPFADGEPRIKTVRGAGYQYLRR